MRILNLLTIILFCFIVNSNAYSEGKEPNPPKFYYKGDGGMNPKTCLYKIDGKIRDFASKDFYPFSYNKGGGIGKFDIETTIGTHSFEIIFNDKSSVNRLSKIIVAKKITIIDMQPDNEYILERDNFEFNIICINKYGKTKANYTIEDVMQYTEPSEGEKFAVITYSCENYCDEDTLLKPYIARIDDKVTSELGEIRYKIHYTWSVDFKYFNNPKGELSIKLLPGKHKLEYIIFGPEVKKGFVQQKEFSFESGKKYKIVVEKLPLEKSETLVDVDIKLIEY